MKRSWFAALAFAVAVFVPVAGVADDDTEAARRSIDAARELYSSGNWETAREAYDEALDSAADGSIEEAEASLGLASILWEQGEYRLAEKQARAAMTLAKERGLNEAVGRLLLTLGHIEASLGRLGDAESTLKICVKSARDQRDANFEALCNINLRFVRQLRGKSIGSEAQYRRHLKTLEKSGQQVLVGTALAKSAELQERAGDHAGALNTLRDAQGRFVASGSVPGQSRNKLRIAQALQNLGRWSEAGAELDGVVLTFRNMKNRPALVTAYALRGKQRAQEGEASEALKDLKKAYGTAKQLQSPQLIANTELALCEFYANADRAESAKTHCRAASKGFATVGAPTLAARSHILLARLAQAKQQWLEARKEYVEALRILQEDVAASAQDNREVAVQQVNLCQVEMQLDSNGAHRRCLDARSALSKVKASDASFRGMVAATQYGVGATAPDDQTKRAIEAFATAAREWASLGHKPQAADAKLRMGKRQLESSKTKKQARATFEEAAKTLGKPADGKQTELAVQIGMQLAQRQLADSDWDEAAESLESVIRHAAATNDDYSGAWAYSAIARAELKRGNRDEAIAALKKGRPLAQRAGDEELLQLFDQNLSKLSDKQ